jgi:hypothetical protein
VSNQTWVQTLVSSQIDSTALTASTTPTSILPPSARFIIPANYFSIGSVLRVRAYGRITTVVTTPGTLALAFMLGPTSNISVFTPAAMALNIVAQTNATWSLEMMLTCRAIGASTTANFMGSGRWLSRAALNAPAAGTTLGVGEVLLPDTAPVVGTGFDSTVANTADLFATWSLNNADSIQTHMYTLESMN